MPTLQMKKYEEFLDSYGVTKHGFIPAEMPLERLPHVAYSPWEVLVADLPRLIKTQRIRDCVNCMPVISTAWLRSEREWRRAYTIMGFLTHAYLWSGDEPSKVIPPQITVPFLAICEHLDLPPILTYAGSNLWNYKHPEGCSPAVLETLQVPITFTGTETESWFLAISVAIEVAGAPVIAKVVEALDHVKEPNFALISSALMSLRDSIECISGILDRMNERCIPDVFYNEVRPLLAGTNGMASLGLPQGVFYDEGHGKGQWRALRGGSNGQSSLIQFWDLALGINHKGEPLENSSTGDTQQPTFHEEVREYMPGPHRAFLEYIQTCPSIRDLALSEISCPEHQELHDTYQKVIEALTDFRNIHIRIVTRFIVLPAKKAQKSTKKIDLASASAGGKPTNQLTGTGGTALMPFLKQARDETKMAGKKE